MVKKYISLLLALSLIGIGLNCGRTKTQDKGKEIAQKEEAQILDESSRPLGKQRGKRRAQVVGKGFERKAPSKIGGGGWGLNDVVVLSDEEKKAIEIETVQASVKPLRSQLAAMGRVLAHQLKKAIVSYAFPARIAQIHVRSGDWVKTGQRLLTLQSEEVGNAKSEFYKAKADHELAKVSFKREKRLFDRGVGAQKDFLASEAGFKVAEANLNATEKKLDVLGFTEEQVKSIAETHQINPIITLFLKKERNNNPI